MSVACVSWVWYVSPVIRLCWDLLLVRRGSYDAQLFIDECHATGHLGSTGRGTPELCGLEPDQVSTGTFGFYPSRTSDQT